MKNYEMSKLYKFYIIIFGKQSLIKLNIIYYLNRGLKIFTKMKN